MISITLALLLQISGEVEFTQTTKGQQAYDVKLFPSVGKAEFLGRYFSAEKGPHRGEFAAGKLLSFNERLKITPYAGVTTDGAIFVPVVITTQIAGRDALYIHDRKFFRGPEPDTLWQQAAAAINRSGAWQFRWERFDVVGKATILNRFGIEKRFGNEKHHLFAALYQDTVTHDPGLYGGVRFRQ